MFNNPSAPEIFRWLSLSDLTLKVTKSSAAGVDRYESNIIIILFFLHYITKGLQQLLNRSSQLFLSI